MVSTFCWKCAKFELIEIYNDTIILDGREEQATLMFIMPRDIGETILSKSGKQIAILWITEMRDHWSAEILLVA